MQGFISRDMVAQSHVTPDRFSSIRCSLASPERIRSWSYGEVKRPETINYRTLKPESDGLFCAKIFGPLRDMQCLCGKYKRHNHRGIKCEKCEVEVTLARTRRERMGHITLAAPVAHVWFLRALPSRIGLMLDMTLREVERVLYFDSFVVLDSGVSDTIKERDMFTELQYREIADDLEDDDVVVETGAEAIQRMLQKINLEQERDHIREELDKTTAEQRTKRLIKRLHLVNGMINSGSKAEWMILTVLPVLPPDLRPLVALDGGRFASSDLNELYRRVINRNLRLSRLEAQRAPDIIIRNEKRMLQVAVDSLLDNGRSGRAIKSTFSRRPLKSLADVIKGKQGRFRQNLLGKRVDYSGRSVIVVGPQLKLHQCGLPKRMALELFKPHVFGRLQEDERATTLKAARKLVEREVPEVWDMLGEAIYQHPVLLNRAPTLHRLGIQAFEPVLIEGQGIQLHPLVCTAFNADFDGDQMAVHVPLTLEAQLEARVLMMSTNNILSPGSGEPIITPTKDMVLGLYYTSRVRPGAKGEGEVFADPIEVERAYETKQIDLHAQIKVRLDANGEHKIVETSHGRLKIWNIVPKAVSFDLVNRDLTSKRISELVNAAYRVAGNKALVIFADKLMALGFSQATRSGSSLCLADLTAPKEKAEVVAETQARVADMERMVLEGQMTAGEKANHVRDAWDRATTKVSRLLMDAIGEETFTKADGTEVKDKSFNSLFMFMDSGARGSEAQIRQLAGIRGLIAKPDGSIIETPITASFRDGLSVLQYFISTHGARKGLADIALKTATSGYLTRRLVDVAQDVVITLGDCKTTRGISLEAVVEGAMLQQTLAERILGRVVSEAVVDNNGEELIPANTLIEEHHQVLIDDAAIQEIVVRSPVTCEAERGICAYCYGRDLARGSIVGRGEAVGVIAAQSIGEPGTQLTMRTFHIGGAASASSREDTLRAGNNGTVVFQHVRTVTRDDGKAVVISHSAEIFVLDLRGNRRERYALEYGSVLNVGDGDTVTTGQEIARLTPLYQQFITTAGGTVRLQSFVENTTVAAQEDETTGTRIYRVMPGSRDWKAVDGVGQPTVELLNANGDVVEALELPSDAEVRLADGDTVGIGRAVARLPKEQEKTVDITGGLPRVAELFEARQPKNPAVLSPQAGVVRIEGEVRTKRRLVIVADDGTETEVMVPSRRPLNVISGARVEIGDSLIDGPLSATEMFSVFANDNEEIAIERVTAFLVSGIQKVYREQGVRIGDKHIEVIVRQMLCRVHITDAGETPLMPEQEEHIQVVRDINVTTEKRAGKIATFRRLLLGITKAALSNRSFISAAAFQESTKVLTDAATQGRRDPLEGLKENVVVGRLIPAGTGLRYHDIHSGAPIGEPIDSTPKDMEDFIRVGLAETERRDRVT